MFPFAPLCGVGGFSSLLPLELLTAALPEDIPIIGLAGGDPLLSDTLGLTDVDEDVIDTLEALPLVRLLPVMLPLELGNPAISIPVDEEVCDVLETLVEKLA